MSMQDIAQLANQVGLQGAGMAPLTGGLPERFGNGAEIAKALSPSSNAVGINLEPQAKLMMPLYTILRKRLPADTPDRGGLAAIYKAFLAHGVSFGTMGSSIQTGDIGPEQTNAALTFTAPYATQSFNDKVIVESIDMARGFDDPMQISTTRLLVALLKMEELMIIGANITALGAPTGLAAALTTTGGALATITSVMASVTALNYEGWTTPSVGGTLAYGESLPATVAVTTLTGTTNKIDLTWTAVPGAVAYNVYLSDGTNNRRVATTLVNKYTATALATAGAAPPSADTTGNANTYEGLFAWCCKSVVYGITIPNKVFVDNAGAALTGVTGGISEIDNVLQQLWVNWQTGPTMILCSPQAGNKMTQVLVGTGNNLNYWINVTDSQGRFQGGVFLGGYTNKFATDLQGMPQSIPVVAHPYMPNGSFLFLSERVPYAFSRERRGIALDVLRPYTYFPLAPVTRSYPYALFMEETLKCYHPGAQAALVGVNVL